MHQTASKTAQYAVALQPEDPSIFDLRDLERVPLSLPVGNADCATVLCALAVLLERYSGQTEVAFSQHGGEESRTFTIDLSGSPAFNRLPERMSKQPEKGANARFMVKIPEAVLSRLQDALPGSDRSDSPLGLDVDYKQGETRFGLLYEANQLSQDRVRVFARQFEQTLKSGLANPDEKSSRLDVVPPEERRQLLVDWNSTEAEVPLSTIHAMLEQQARAKPHAVALISGEHKVTYEELNARANRLAHRLRRAGAGPEQLVGMFIEPSIDAVIATLGILKSGAAYVPLDVSHPPHRIESIVGLAGLSRIVTTGRHRASLPRTEAQVFMAEDSSVAILAADLLNPAPLSNPDSCAYVMFTSGSTGEPKGVVGTHRSVANGIPAALFDRNQPDEVCCLNAPLSIGISLLALFLPLVLGASLVVFSDEEMKDIVRFVNLVRLRKITNVALPPHMLREFLNFISQRSETLPSLHTVMVGGAGVTSDVVEHFSRLLPHAVLYNGYGSSELGSIATKGRLTGRILSRAIPAGRPIANTKVYLLDSERNLVPVGAVGEIYIGAKHLARGYLNRPDLDAERFLPNPFTGVDGDRLYRTGDLGLFSLTGELQVTGRCDQQVKIRGFRVELEDVESALNKCPGVIEAAAAAHELSGENRLVGYIVAREGLSLRERDIRAYLRQQLPEYMVPSALVFLSGLPVSPGGKLDRTALPAPDGFRSADEQEYQEPRNRVEAALAEIWEELLGLDRVGIKENFLDLGGDSLFAVKLSVRILEVFGLEVSMDQLIESPTVELLAEQLLRGGGPG